MERHVEYDDDRKRRKRPPPRLSEAGLERVAAHWIKRFWGPTAGLRRVLRRHAHASQQAWGGDEAEANAMVEALIARLVDVGLLNDREVAVQRARSMHERGVSAFGIRGRLRAAGLADEDVQAGLAGLHDGQGDPEWRAAVAYARRRRLGPFRVQARAERRQRDLAAMARAGFSFDLARRVVDSPELG